MKDSLRIFLDQFPYNHEITRFSDAEKGTSENAWILSQPLRRKPGESPSMCSMEAPSFLLPDWLKLNHLKSRMECGFSDIFSLHICSIVAETIVVTSYVASFGGKNVQKTTFEAAEMMLGPWNQQDVKATISKTFEPSGYKSSSVSFAMPTSHSCIETVPVSVNMQFLDFPRMIQKVKHTTSIVEGSTVSPCIKCVQ